MADQRTLSTTEEIQRGKVGWASHGEVRLDGIARSECLTLPSCLERALASMESIAVSDDAGISEKQPSPRSIAIAAGLVGSDRENCLRCGMMVLSPNGSGRQRPWT
jgi:hypothetical protein